MVFCCCLFSRRVGTEMVYIAFWKDWISTMKIGWGSVANSDRSHG